MGLWAFVVGRVPKNLSGYVERPHEPGIVEPVLNHCEDRGTKELTLTCCKGMHVNTCYKKDGAVVPLSVCIACKG